ncbi:MAG TPA: hypothetical protein VFU72_03105 [Nitrolancea sp.]|nr:hypothetical protein [Nitrolancea sp.]
MMDGYHWEQMGNGMGSWGWVGAIAMAVFGIVVLALAVSVIVRLASNAPTRHDTEPSGDRAEALLRERFARGEIFEAEYRQA